MWTDPLPTPTAYLSQLRTLIATGHDQKALDYSASVWPRLAPSMTGEELDIASGLLAGAESALDYAARDDSEMSGTVGLSRTAPVQPASMDKDIDDGTGLSSGSRSISEL